MQNQNTNQQQGQKGYYSPEQMMMYNQNQNQNPNYNVNFNLQNQKQKLIEKKKKVFEERAGDWVCMKCKNLNFSFRIICNRCKIPKVESEKLYDEHIKSLYNYVKINEMYQNQVLKQNYNNNPNQVFINKLGNVQQQQFNQGNVYNQGYNQNCNNLDVYSTESLNNGYN